MIFKCAHCVGCFRLEITLQEPTILFIGQLMVVRKIGQVEKDIAHAGIFPIQDIEVTVGKEICIEQIVVTRTKVEVDEMPGPASAACSPFDQPIKILREGHLVAVSNLGIIRNNPKNIKRAWNFRHGMDFSDDIHDLADIFRSTDLIRQDRASG